MEKMIVWALFDSGNGCYKQASNEKTEIYSIGMDRENKNDRFLNLDLASYKYMFGDNSMFEELNKLPNPDLIIASPPCESWSLASGMGGGNACWKTDKMENLFGTMKGSTFTVRDYSDYEGYQFIPERQILTRLNGELCIYNTIKIIKEYKPKFWIIENPAHGKIWEYIENILGFKIYHENMAYYYNYGFDIKKPTKFASNLFLGLDKKTRDVKSNWDSVSGYNERSNIPLPLIEKVYKEVYKNVESIRFLEREGKDI